MKASETDIIIVGGGLAGLACAHRLKQANIPFLILEANHQVGGRVKTENLDGFLLDYGFQVLQTAYPEARRILDFDRLKLKNFAPGAIIRVDGKFHRIADPRRRPREFLSTLKAPIGTLGDRLRILRLAHNVRNTTIAGIFRTPDMPAVDFLRSEGFSEKIIQRFFKPFFAGVCLDPEIKASSRVFRHIFRVFSEGEAAVPSLGMGAIPEQLAQGLPNEQIRTGVRAQSIEGREVVLTSGEKVKGRAIVLATQGPEAARLLGIPDPIGSRGELCLYFTAQKSPIAEPYLILNGDGDGWVNSLTVPSIVAPSYAPVGHALISVVVIGHLSADNAIAEKTVRYELTEWFGSQVSEWRHLKTYRIMHALPQQPPPMPNPMEISTIAEKPGIYVCGEYGSVPGIQWALLSGRRVAEKIIRGLNASGR